MTTRAADTSTGEPSEGFALELRPGVPGVIAPEQATTEYPDVTEEFEEILAELGCSVRTPVSPSNRTRLVLRGPDIWLPVIVVAQSVGLGALGSLLAEAVVRMYDRHKRQPATRSDDANHVHLLVGRDESDSGVVEWLEFEGDVDVVVQTLQAMQP